MESCRRLGAPDEDPTGGFEHGGWVAGYFDEVVEAAMAEIFSRPDELLLGRNTYDLFAAYWPHITDPQASISRSRNSSTASRSTSRRIVPSRSSGRTAALSVLIPSRRFAR